MSVHSSTLLSFCWNTNSNFRILRFTVLYPAGTGVSLVLKGLIICAAANADNQNCSLCHLRQKLTVKLFHITRIINFEVCAHCAIPAHMMWGENNQIFILIHPFFYWFLRSLWRAAVGEVFESSACGSPWAIRWPVTCYNSSRLLYFETISNWFRSRLYPPEVAFLFGIFLFTWNRALIVYYFLKENSPFNTSALKKRAIALWHRREKIFPCFWLFTFII